MGVPMSVYTNTRDRLKAVGAPRRECVALAIGWALRVLPSWEAVHPKDDRPRVALVTAARWLAGKATKEECRTAANASWSAYSAAAAAYSADAATAADGWRHGEL